MRIRAGARLDGVNSLPCLSGERNKLRRRADLR
jgi:hypothetical protein